MKILLVHNKYKLSGGEDSVFETERIILENEGHIVKTFFFDNADIDNTVKKIKLSYRLIYNKNSSKTINDLIRSFRPDVIHVHNFFYVASPSIFFAANQNKIPVIVTLHNYRLICSGALLMRNAQPCELCIHKIFPIQGIRYKCHRDSAIETAELTLATGIHKLIGTWNTKVSIYISLTEFARNKFINSSLNLLPERIVVKPNSVDDVEPSSYSERENYFLFIGRLSEEKGIKVVLQAFENKTAVVEIIGEGPLKDLVEKASKNNSNIKYVGYKDKAYIISRLKKCRAIIVPSICYESLPTAILEAYSTGTPVISSDIDNLNEIVTNGYNGLHFKTNSAADLYRVAEYFNENHAQYLFLYSNARKTYLEKYTPKINYERLINIYKVAIDNHRD